jgi:hypothetical protein
MVIFKLLLCVLTQWKNETSRPIFILYIFAAAILRDTFASFYLSKAALFLDNADKI